jgi:hypothetical protein
MTVTLEKLENLRAYIYSPLAGDSIRLFSLNEDTSDAFSGTLKTVRLNDAPPYFCLSYAWGTQKQVVPVQVDDQVLYVTPSLAVAMQRLQELNAEDSASDTRVKWVWIDRICINQDDISERSEQVQLMGSIYSQAIRTLIWVGPELDSCSAAWLLIDQIYDIFKRENPCAKYLADIPFRIYSDQNHAASGFPGWNHDLWRNLRRLFELQWFTRTWIIQEVALSQEDPVILHGQHRYPWHRLGWACSWLRRNGYMRLAQIPNQMQNVDTISNIRRSRTRWRLDALLVATSTKFHAADQRDKVYGLLGLAAESQGPAGIPDALRPDYELGVQQVYKKVALFFLWEYKTLSVLALTSGVAGDASQTKRKYNFELFPSWVPNWCDYTVTDREITKGLFWIYYSNNGDAATLGFPDHYNASAGLPAKLLKSPDQSVLRLGGLKADTVVSAVRFNDGMQSTDGHAREPPILRFWKAAVPFLPERRAMDWISSFIKATTAEQYRLSGNTAEQILKDGSAYLLDLLSSNKYQELHLPSHSDGQDIIGLLRALSVGGNPESYASLAGNYCFNRSFVVTSNGHMGIGPAGTRSEDFIAVIFGGGVPYILQKQERGLLFVGDSYIHGLMDGEAVQAWQKGELTEEILELL